MTPRGNRLAPVLRTGAKRGWEDIMRNLLWTMVLIVLCLAAGPVAAAPEGGGSPNPLEFRYDTAFWAVVVFVLLLVILRKTAWGPILEGLQKREQSILSAVEEAKHARAETVKVTNEFKVKMDQAYAEIPKMMETARRDAQNLAEEMRAKANQDIQAERARLRREIDMARDQALQELWNQTAQLATLISAKAIGRSLTEDDHRRLIDEALTEMTNQRRT
jgi:F-type H+-transporting ATPase subunit b